MIGVFAFCMFHVFNFSCILSCVSMLARNIDTRFMSVCRHLQWCEIASKWMSIFSFNIRHFYSLYKHITISVGLNSSNAFSAKFKSVCTI